MVTIHLNWSVLSDIGFPSRSGYSRSIGLAAAGRAPGSKCSWLEEPPGGRGDQLSTSIFAEWRDPGQSSWSGLPRRAGRDAIIGKPARTGAEPVRDADQSAFGKGSIGMPPRNVVVAQSGGPTCVINNSLRGIIEACRSHPGAFGKVLRRPVRDRGGAQGRADRPVGDLGRGDRAVAHLAGGGEHRHLPIQAQEGAGRGLPARRRGLQGPRRRHVLLHRRQRLAGHGPQGQRAGPRQRPRPRRRRRAQDDRQRPRRRRVPAPRPLARLRLGGPLLRPLRPPGERGERRLVPGRPGAGHPGDGPEDRLHPGRRPAGRPRAGRCRSRSTWPSRA